MHWPALTFCRALTVSSNRLLDKDNMFELYFATAGSQTNIQLTYTQTERRYTQNETETVDYQVDRIFF